MISVNALKLSKAIR